MIIKEIIVQGFKSFKDRTVIAIDEPVVAIVGPNGCGKSNIVDAMKWVLGEQSAKSLRGDAMDDVIYNGGAQGKGAGLSDVSIKFSTSDGKIPSKYLSYSEIQITRRLYRSGESEYLINRTLCRLKDIHDLIMGTGAGAKAYAIVSQGHIEKFTTAKPAERRFFIEEAAGITRYKVRKEAAGRKIEFTKHNLLRLNDIVRELQKQNISLKRQSEAAERYKELKNQLREFDLQIAASSFISIRSGLDKDSESFESMRSEIGGIEAEISAKELNIEESRLTLQEEEAFIASLQSRIYDGLKELQRAETDIKIREKEIEETGRQCEDDRKYLSGLQSKLETLKTEDVSLSDGSSVAVQEIEREKEVLENSEKEYAEKKEKLTAIVARREEYRNSIIQVLTEMSQARNRRQFIEQNLTTGEVRIEQKEKEKEALSAKSVDIHEKHVSVSRELVSIRDARDRVEEEREVLQQKLEEWKGELSSNRADYENIRNEMAVKSSRLTSLEEMRNNYDGYHDGVKSIMLDYPDRERLHGLVGDNVTVDPKFEVALESILGEQIQGIIINQPQEGSDAISHLRTRTAGRSSFIPITLRASSKSFEGNYRSVESLGDSSFLGYLREKIQIEKEYGQIADFLFRDVAIVKDFSSAMHIWQTEKVKDTMVTLSGDIITPEGVVSGGSVEAISSGILQKKREIEELYRKIDELEVKHTLISETIRRIQLQVDEAESKKENLLQFGHTEDLRILNLDKDEGALKSEIDRVTNSISLIQLELERLKDENRDLENQRNQANIVIERNEVIHSECEKKVEAVEAEERNLSQIIEEDAHAITEAKVRFASLKERVEAFESRKNRLAYDISQTAEDVACFEKKIGDAGERVRTLEEEIRRLKRTAENLVILDEKAGENLRSRREKFQSENREIIDVEARIRELRQGLTERQNRFNHLQLSLGEARIRLENLVRETFEKSGADLEEVARKIHDENGLICDDEEMEVASRKASKIRARIEAMGDVNIMAIEEHRKVSERLEFLVSQRKDLEKAISSLEKTIEKIDLTSKERFEVAFNAINEQFKRVFPKLFKGGSASLILCDPEDLLNTGVDIVVQPPGKKFQNINLFSGGEKALTAISLIFSIFLINPAPFCVLDEVDAPLDDSNIVRFNSIIRQMSQSTQFILITHNKRTMEVAQRLYGITMEDAGYSKLVTVKFEDLDGEPV